jgi:hypothetical protein
VESPGAGARRGKETRMGQPIVHFEIVGKDADKLVGVVEAES